MTTPAYQDYLDAQAGVERLNQQLDQAASTYSELRERLVRMIAIAAMGVDNAEAIQITRQSLRTSEEIMDTYPDAIKIAEQIVQEKYKSNMTEMSAAQKTEKAARYAQLIAELTETPRKLTLMDERELRTLAPKLQDAVAFIKALTNYLFRYNNTPNPPAFKYPPQQGDSR